MDVNAMNIDMLSMSRPQVPRPQGHRRAVHPQGRTAGRVSSHGGAQERAQRAGTENLAGIVGMGKAIELATHEPGGQRGADDPPAGQAHRRHSGEIPEVTAQRPPHGAPAQQRERSPSADIEGEALLLRLDLAGIAGSSGSACTSGSLDPSHVLLAIGLPHEIAHGSLRLSLGTDSTEAEVDASAAGSARHCEGSAGHERTQRRDKHPGRQLPVHEIISGQAMKEVPISYVQ